MLNYSKLQIVLNFGQRIKSAREIRRTGDLRVASTISPAVLSLPEIIEYVLVVHNSAQFSKVDIFRCQVLMNTASCTVVLKEAEISNTPQCTQEMKYLWKFAYQVLHQIETPWKKFSSLSYAWTPTSLSLEWKIAATVLLENDVTKYMRIHSIYIYIAFMWSINYLNKTC